MISMCNQLADVTEYVIIEMRLQLLLNLLDRSGIEAASPVPVSPFDCLTAGVYQRHDCRLLLP
jgi:hypothetical protein